MASKEFPMKYESAGDKLGYRVYLSNSTFVFQTIHPRHSTQE